MAIRKSVDGDPRVIGPGAVKGLHSRVISCMLVATSAADTYALTQPVGQRVWLLGVKLWHRHAGVTTNSYTLTRFYTGTTQIRSAAEMLLWDEILPVSGYGDDLIYWRLYDEWPAMEWSMQQLFVGEGRRFGFHAGRQAGALSDEMYCSFEVAEG